MVELSEQALLVNLVALFCCVAGIREVSTGCSDVCEYYEWGKDAKCQGRDLTFVPQECKHAKTLRMQDNRLQQLMQGSFSNFTCLKYLYLDRNNLTLQNGAFEGCEMLQQIHLNENRIPTLKPDMMKGLSNVLYMFMNKAEMKVIQPDAFQNMSQLQYLSLQDNELTTVPCDAFSTGNSLHTLYLDSNKITYLPDDCFSRFLDLTKLYLKNNPLGDLNSRAFRGLVNLIHLDLQYTNLTRVPTGIFPYANKIQTLHLSFNNIQFLHNRDFASLSGLKKLYLQHNRIISIQSHSFEFLDSLNVLDLSFNMIKSIETDALNNFPLLTNLRLQHNKLNSTQNITFSDIPQGAQLHLSQNPLHCDCSIYPLQYWLDGATWMTPDAGPSYLARCSTPETFQGQLITELGHQDICPSGNGVMPGNEPLTPALPLFSKDSKGHQQLSKSEDMPTSAASLDSKMIGIITGVAVLIIFSVGGIIILIMKRRHDRYPVSNDLCERDLKYGMKPPVSRHPPRDMNITENPMDEGPALPPRPDVYPNMPNGQQRRSTGSFDTQPPTWSNHHLIDVKPVGDTTDNVGYISPMALAEKLSKPTPSTQASLLTSTPPDDGDYSSVVFPEERHCEDNEEEPSAADWLKKNFIPPSETDTTVPSSANKNPSYIQWRT